MSILIKATKRFFLDFDDFIDYSSNQLEMSSNTNTTPVEAEIDEIDPSEMWTAEEKEEYFRDMEECPLLMDHFTEVCCIEME